MNKQQIDDLVIKWGNNFNPHKYKENMVDTQFDDRSAMINYCMIREHKPKVVVEFGARYGRCSRDIYQALKDNGGEFTFLPFEIGSDERIRSQEGLDHEFGLGVIKVGKDVMQADLPKNIDYLFVDHSHDEPMSRWVIDELIPNHCKYGCIVQIHDLPLSGDWEIRKNPWNETQILKDMHLAGTLKLEKIYWTFEEGDGWESTWWKYRK